MDDWDAYELDEFKEYTYKIPLDPNWEAAVPYDHLGTIKFRYGTYYKTNEPRCFPGDIFPMHLGRCEFHNAPTLPDPVEFPPDWVGYWTRGSWGFQGEYTMMSYGATINLSDRNIHIENIEPPEGSGAGNYVDVMNNENTVEMGRITVTKLPDCGTMEYVTGRFDKEDVLVGESYDIGDDSGIFFYDADLDCADDSYNNNWEYYYHRAAVG